MDYVLLSVLMGNQFVDFTIIICASNKYEFGLIILHFDRNIYHDFNNNDNFIIYF